MTKNSTRTADKAEKYQHEHLAGFQSFSSDYSEIFLQEKRKQSKFGVIKTANKKRR